jgi:transposase
MAHISGFERDQLLLLPEAVDDYVGSDNPVRFIDAFVDGLDLVEAGFARVQPKATGRPGYAPSDLIKLYVYGYLNRVRSSRRLEGECHRNIEVIWLLRTLKPDFKTIADFRAENRTAFKSVFRQFTLLCKRLDLFGREILAVDGTRIKAVNNKDRNFTRNSWRHSSRRPTSGWRITSRGSTKATPPRRLPAAPSRRGNPRSRQDRRRHGQGILPNRGHRGLRAGGADALCAQAATRLLRQQRLLSQG